MDDQNIRVQFLVAERNLSVSTVSRLAQGSTQSLIEWLLGLFLWGYKEQSMNVATYFSGATLRCMELYFDFPYIFRA